MSEAPSYPGVPALPSPAPATVLRLALTAALGSLTQKQRRRMRWDLEGAAMALRNQGANRWNVVSLLGRSNHGRLTPEGLTYMAAADCLEEALAAIPWAVLLRNPEGGGQ